MSKIRDLPENTSPATDDLFYIVDASAGPNAGRKLKYSVLRASVLPIAAEVKALYEANDNTNAFTDAEKSKLAGIETGATADQLASEVPYSNASSGLQATEVQAAIDEVAGIADGGLKVTIESGRIVRFTAGAVRINGVYYTILAGALLLNASVTNGRIYVDVDGVVKSNSGGEAPPLAIPIALFSTDLTSVLTLTDRRIKLANNVQTGAAGDITGIAASNAQTAGSTNKFADAGHIHAVSTAAAVGLSASTANGAGSSANLARADHTHAVATGAPSTQNADQANNAGSSANLARADHVHQIPTAAPSNTGTANAQGSAGTFAKSDHVHNTVIAWDGASATVDDTTASLTDVLMVGMTKSVALAASYELTFSGSIVNSANGAERTWVSFYVNGVQVAESERSVGTSGGAYAPTTVSCIAPVGAGQTVEVRWRVAGGTSTVRRRCFTLKRLG